jgi:hypothetical protein
MRRTDIWWSDVFKDWSDYDLDAMAQDIREEKIRRHAKPAKGFLAP